MSTTLSGREGDLVSVCVEVQSGSVQRPSLSVELAVTDITTSGMFSYSISTKMSTLILLHYIGVSYYIRFFTYYSLFENFYFRVFWYHAGPFEYTVLQNLFNIPDGTNVGNTFCANIRLLADNTLEEPEEIFSVNLINPVATQVPDTALNVTIIDGDGMSLTVHMVYGFLTMYSTVTTFTQVSFTITVTHSIND